MSEQEIFEWLQRYPHLIYIDSENDKIYVLSSKGLFITINKYKQLTDSMIKTFVNRMRR